MEKPKVIIPEPIPDDLLTVPACPEVDEITWGDGRAASDHYRRCKDLRGQRIHDLATTVRGRWDWLRGQKQEIEQDDAEAIDEAVEDARSRKKVLGIFR